MGATQLSHMPWVRPLSSGINKPGRVEPTQEEAQGEERSERRSPRMAHQDDTPYDDVAAKVSRYLSYR